MSQSPCNCGCLTDPQFVIHLQKRCFLYARRRMTRENAEDFASWAVIHFLETKRHFVPWMFVDFLRQTIGDVRCKNFKTMYAIYNPDELAEEK